MKINNKLAVFGFVLLAVASSWSEPRAATPPSGQQDPPLVEQGIQWETDFKTAMNLAQETNRLVLIHFYGDQCPPCRAMDRDVFPHQAVADALTPHFVPLKVNSEQNPKAVKNLNITSIPMDLIVTPSREIIFRRKGGCSAEQYVEELLSFLRTRQTQQEVEISDAERLKIAQVHNQPKDSSQSSVFPAEANSQALKVPQAETTHVLPILTESPVVSQTALLDTSSEETPELFVPGIDAQQYEDFSLPSASHTFDESNMDDFKEGTDLLTEGLADHAAPAAMTNALAGLSIPNLQPGLQPTEERENPADYESPYILDGFCPVELQDREHWVSGKTDFALHYKDRFFLFSSKEAMVTFSKNPHHYIPVAMGEDVVQILQGGQRIKGKRHYGAWYQGRIYLFTTQENYNAFAQRPSYFADFALKLESALGANASPVRR